MVNTPSPETVTAWARLIRIQQTVLGLVEAELKAGGFPPLAWYDALLELSRVPTGKLRPLELENQMLLPQYSMSRLIDRLSKAGYVTRESFPDDGRGQMIAITPEGLALQKTMWGAYSAAIERHVGTKLSSEEARELSTLLAKLGIGTHPE